MKIRSLAVLFAASLFISITSCNWFRSSSEAKASNPLLGKWHLDSVRPGKDTNLAHVFIYMAMKDSGGINFEFKEDTIFSYSSVSDRDTTLYQFDEKSNRMIVQDSTRLIYEPKKVNDSSIVLTIIDTVKADTSMMFLKRQ